MAISPNTAKAAAAAIRSGHQGGMDTPGWPGHDDGDACLELATRLEREAEAAHFARLSIDVIEADPAEADRTAWALAEAEALVMADQGGATPQQLLALAERALRMAAGLREHLVAGRLLDAWAAADWLGDLAQEVKGTLPVSSQDILAAVEGDTLPPAVPVVTPYDAAFHAGGRPSEEELCGCPRCVRARAAPPPQPRDGGQF